MKIDSIEARLLEYLRASLAVDAELGLELDRETPLLDLGILDSLAIVDLMRQLELDFGVTVSESEIVAENFRTVAAVARLVQSKAVRSASAGLRSGAVAAL